MPWIFLFLMIVNAIYFGWSFMQGGQPQARPLFTEVVQQGAPIQLLAERPKQVVIETQEEKAETKEDDSAAPRSSPVISIKQCYSVGPFGSEPASSSWAGQMQGKGYVAKIDKRKVDIKEYKVFVPAFTNRAKAEERLLELRGAGENGAFIIKEGSYINAIALNSFKNKELALAYLQKIQQKGFAAELREEPKNTVEYWVFVMPGGAKTELRSVIDAFLVKQSDFRRENSPCNE